MGCPSVGGRRPGPGLAALFYWPNAEVKCHNIFKIPSAKDVCLYMIIKEQPQPAPLPHAPYVYDPPPPPQSSET